MIGIEQLMREGRDALIAHRFRGEPLSNPYSRGTKRGFWWSRGVERATRKVSELMEIGQ
ncbi:hypothetical protein EDF56_101167 [Novosphingobium sp. PhB165]|uniref:hypothetical protein n=1 Tax=Novosphingobium sp. PhB165 TaxID=2485105 RepID=UPI0010DB24D6|nr:hypothetical protein [Novosphingobium sp. PhB165]TCM21503.1 hypothetical protein EDF56_101167 [Novosphingobium sp. PhB165]